MLNNVLKNYILTSTLGLLKGKKRWLAILVLLVAQVTQSAGVDLGSFVADVVNLLQSAEG